MRVLILQIIIVLFFGLRTEAQFKLGTIVDKDGFAVIKETPAPNSKTIDSAKQGDFVNCDSVLGNWIKVIEFKWYVHGPNNGKQITGYILKSKVKLIENLTTPEQKSIILNTLKDYSSFINERKTFLNTHLNYGKRKWDNKADSLKMNEYNSLSFTLADTRFNPLLVYIESFYCRTKDIEVLNKLFAFLYNNKGSAVEQPAFSLAECFICSPDKILNLLNNMNNMNNNEQVNYIKGQIAAGLAGHFNVNPEAKKQTNKEYIKYMDFLKYNKK
jgi:hypothetical protein